MLTDNLVYFHFTPLEWLEAYEHLGPSYSESDCLDIYRKWIDMYARRNISFCRSQYANRLNILRDRFCRQYSINPNGSWSEYVQSAFDEFIDSQGMTEHQFSMERSMCTASEYLDGFHSDRPLWVTSNDAMDHVLGIMNGTIRDLGVCTFELWNLWFDKSTGIGQDDQEHLKRIPYPEYLQSSYWRRVRSAMLLTYRLRCQGKPCIGSDSYFADEQYLHVHHMHYKNKGHETLDNLRLLCDDCHQRFHSGESDIVASFNYDLMAF